MTKKIVDHAERLQSLQAKLVSQGANLSTLGEYTAALLRKPAPLVFATQTYQRMAKQLVRLSNGKLELGCQERKN